jgi:Acetyltransferases, including N-acetylases of ribosomal proteins
MKGRQLFVDENILLKEIGLEDVESIFSTIVKERTYLEKWLPFVEATQDISYTRTFVENYLDSDQLDLTCVILFKKQIVGVIGLKDTDLHNKRTEIGYWLSESFQHKGIITKSCKRLIDYAFCDLNLNRVQIKAATENSKSRAIPERLGFIQEGIERDGELHKRGFVDLVVYALLKNEWAGK